jgi:putative nucleotidyltransferase with HDIG domain
MNFISFKSLKLFKQPSSRPPKNGEPPPAQREDLPVWRKVVQDPFFQMAAFVLILSYFISYAPSRTLPRPEVGEIARTDIISPNDLTVEDNETTAERKRQAADAVLPVYVFDKDAFPNTEERIRQTFQAGQAWLRNPASRQNVAELEKQLSEQHGLEIPAPDLESLAREKFSAELQDTLISLIGKISSRGIVVSKNLFIRREPESGLTLLRGPGNEKVVGVGDILDLKESKDLFAAEVAKLVIPVRQRRLLERLGDFFLVPDITYDRTETEARRDRAAAQVETVFYKIKKGKVIIRKGDEATADTLKWVSLINQHLQEKSGWTRNFAGTFLLFALLFVTLWFYLKSLLNLKPALRVFTMMGVMLLVALLIYKLLGGFVAVLGDRPILSIPVESEVYQFVYPFQFGVILFAFLTTGNLSLIYCILNSLLVGYLFQNNYLLLLFSFLGGLAAIYGIKYYKRQRRTSALKAGLFVVSSINIFLIMTFAFIREMPTALGVFAIESLMGLLGGIAGGAVAFLLLPVAENVFDIVTQAKLLELTNSDLPIFRQMAIEAPGSYHHSLVVATLAEKAAEEIGLDSMLVKAGALYHDIGKIKRPEYFIENMSRNPDVHKDMAPSLSKLVIVNHVKEGAEMARKLKLPKKIREMVEQHHGNSIVRYFYHKAKETYDPEMQEIEEESYRYPGPPPQSKEAALIMLADSIEAASRSLKSTAEENLKRVIMEIFENYLEDGQLDNSDFSLRELRAIATSFHDTLYTIYHPRVEYPGFDFTMKKKKKAENGRKPNGRSPRSAE